MRDERLARARPGGEATATDRRPSAVAGASEQLRHDQARSCRDGSGYNGLGYTIIKG